MNNLTFFKTFRKIFTIITLTFLATVKIYAVPAYPYPVEYQLPDGTNITITLKGDENVNWATSEDGYTLLRNSDGYFEYAILDDSKSLILSGIRANNVDVRSLDETSFLSGIKKDLRYSSEQISYLFQINNMRKSVFRNNDDNNRTSERVFTGVKSFPVILVGFQGKPFTKTQSEFEALLNQPNYTGNGMNGSLFDYFSDASYNNLLFTCDIYGPYTLAGPITDYDDECGGDPREMAKEAIQFAFADGCNFALYDYDNDGYVDGTHIIFAGYGQEGGLPPCQAIWSHASGFSPLYLNGKYVYRYSCSPELRGTTGSNITYIGVIAHELGHIFGLPDLYDTDYAGSGGQSVDMGSWCLMAYGSWGDDGRTPSLPMAWCRNDLGWINCITLASTPDNITLPNPQNEGITYRINTTTTNEYFLLENRQKIGRDASVPGSGMLIYHVDENYSGWNDNSINCDPSHRGLYVKQAGCGTFSDCSFNRDRDPYPYGSNNSFTDATVPDSKSWAGANTNSPITTIISNPTNRTITFAFMGGIIQYTVSVTANPTAGGSVTQSGSGIYDENTSVTVTANPNTNYTFTGWSENGSIVSTDEIYTFSITSNRNLTANFCVAISTFPYFEGFELGTVGPILPDCWMQEYVVGDLDWETKHSSSHSGYGGAHGGDYYISIQYLPPGSYTTKLITPVLNLSGLTSPILKFWHFQQEWAGDQDVLRIYYKTSASGSWNLLQEYDNNVEIWTERTIPLPNTSSSYYIAFEGETNRGRGILIDDVSIGEDIQYDLVLNVNPIGAGTTTGAGQYDENQPVTISATPNSNYIFLNWTEGSTIISTNATYSFNMPPANITYTANFVQQFEVIYDTPINGTLSVDDGINPILSGTFVDMGTELTITAIPDAGYEISTLTVNGNNFTSGDIHTVTSTTTIVCTFALIGTTQYEVIYDTPINGTLSVDDGINTILSGTFVDLGTELTITAIPDAGYEISTLTVNGNNFTSGYIHTVTSTTTIVCTFALIGTTQYEVIYDTPINGTLSVDDGINLILSGTFVDLGTELTITAIPDAGYEISTLTVNGNNFTSGDIHTVTSTTTIVCTFSLIGTTQYEVIYDTPINGTLSVDDGINPILSGTFVDMGTELTITAIPDAGYEISTLTVNGNNFTNGDIHTVTSTTTIVCTFSLIVPQFYTLTLNVYPTGAGTTTGDGQYETDDIVTIFATPNTDYEFLNWTKGTTIISTDNPYTFNMPAEDLSLTANFYSEDNFIVTFNTPSNGVLSVTDNGTEITSGTYVEPGTILTITATPANNYQLGTLTVNGINFQNGDTYEVNSDTEIYCSFIGGQHFFVTLYAYPSGSGTVLGAGRFVENELVEIEAIPNSDYLFINWTEQGNEISTEPFYEFTITTNRTFFANFAQSQNLITYQTPENGSLSVTADGNNITSGTTVDYGTVITIIVTPDDNYLLESLKVNGIDFINGETYIVVSDTYIVCSFQWSDIINKTISDIVVYSKSNTVYIINDNNINLKSVQIMDMLGRVVYQGSTKNSTEIDLNVSTGHYIVKIVSDDGMISTHKVHIKKL